MNEFFPLASAAGMTVGLAVCALIIGLALAMFFAVWESVKWRPVAWAGSALVTILRGLPEILVVLFIYFGSSQLLLTLAGWLHDQSRVRADPGADAHRELRRQPVPVLASLRCHCCMRLTRRKRCVAR